VRCPVTVNLFISFTDSDTILIVGQWIVDGNMKEVKRVVHFFSPIKYLDVLNSNLKAETLHKHNNREKVQVFVCFIRFSSNVNGFNQVLYLRVLTFPL
jgi:hypothetical protein